LITLIVLMTNILRYSGVSAFRQTGKPYLAGNIDLGPTEVGHSSELKESSETWPEIS
jgi:hypothetical protein